MSGRLLVLLALLCCAGCAPAGPPPPAPVLAPEPAPVASAPPAEPPPEPPAVPPAPPPAPCAPLAPPPLRRLVAPIDPPAVEIEDEHGALASFHGKVIELLQGRRKEPVRILMYGDSNLAADWLSGGLRRTLQEALGDGGHGFVALGRPWPGYAHMDMKLEAAGAGWEIFAISSRPPPDRRMGFGGIAVQSRYAGVKVGVGTAREGAPVGRTASWLGVQFLKGPGQGSFEVRVDGGAPLRVDAEAPEFASGLASMSLEDAPHRARIAPLGTRPVRLFGAILERTGPGAVVDAVGVASSIAGTILRQEPMVYRQALAQRAHDLVIFTHGSFDVRPWNPPEGHAASVRAIVALHREVRPDIGVLITSPIDYKGPLDDSRYSPALAAVENRALARENRVAFWDLRAAMGGDRSIATFRAHKMADSDLIHLNEKGGLFVGNRLALALWSDLIRHLAGHPACAAP